MLRLWCRRGPLIRSTPLHTHRCDFPRRFLSATTVRTIEESPPAKEADPEEVKPATPPKSRSKRQWERRRAHQRRAARAAKNRFDTETERPVDTGANDPTNDPYATPKSLEGALTGENQTQFSDPGYDPSSASESTSTVETSEGAAGETPHAGIWTSLRARLQATDQSNASMENTLREEDVTLEEGAEEIAMPSNPNEDEVVLDKKASSTKAKRPRAQPALEVKTIRPHRLRLRPVEEEKNLDVPKLSYNLDRVLFNPGVYHMQDYRSRVFNFDPYLASIMPVEEFDFDALKSYITSSKDVKLRQLSSKHGMKYCGSTSSMTSILSHFHFLLSAWRKPCFDNISRSMAPESLNFTALSRGPAAAFARYKDGVYAIDSDKEFDSENILSMLGKSMEKLLTLPKEEFERYRRSRSHQITEEERNAEESYHYTTMGDFMMRSQLDAHDSRLPGTGMFDLKTRAVVSIRMDVKGYEKGVGYEIRKRFGQWESFEREYYDMIRAAFLKYSLQVRMGRMDGIFVAFHNTQRIFGFQYISLSEMDHAIHGTPDRRIGDQEFKSSLALLNDLMNRATQRFPGRSLRLHVETRPTKVPLTYFFVEPVTDEEMDTTQEASKTSVEQLEQEIRGLSDQEQKAEFAEEKEDALVEQQQLDESDKLMDEASPSDPQTDAAWEEMMMKVDETVENESLGIGSVREAMQNALEQSGLLQDKTEVESEQFLDSLVDALTAHTSKSREAREASDGESDGPEEGLDGQGSATSVDQPSSQGPSLKDLILKVAEGIDDRDHNLRSPQRKFAELVSQSKPPDHSQQNGSAGQEISESDAEVSPDVDGEAVAEEPKNQRELLGMYVTIRNKVNGEFVERPMGTDRDIDWSIQYTVTELPDKRAHQIYSKIKKRRKTVFSSDSNTRSAEWYKMFKGRLPIVTKKGEKYRQQRTEQEAGKSIYVAWDKTPLSPADAPTSPNSTATQT